MGGGGAIFIFRSFKIHVEPNRKRTIMQKIGVNYNRNTNLSFKGAVKFDYSTDEARKLAGIVLPKTMQYVETGKNICMKFYDNTVERNCIDALKEFKIPYVHYNKPNMTMQEFNEFHNFMELG